jgi:hypothetical protein
MQGNLFGPNREYARELQILVTVHQKEDRQAQIIEIPVPDKVIEKVNRICLKDEMQKGLLFKDRNGMNTNLTMMMSIKSRTTGSKEYPHHSLKSLRRHQGC